MSLLLSFEHVVIINISDKKLNIATSQSRKASQKSKEINHASALRQRGKTCTKTCVDCITRATQRIAISLCIRDAVAMAKIREVRFNFLYS